MFPKSLFASRTLWLNALTFTAALLTALSGMTDAIPPALMPYIVAALAAVNIGLRLVTTQPVTISPTP